MENKIQIFGIEVKLNLIYMDYEIGSLKELVFTCNKNISELIIKEAVKNGIAFQRTNKGVNLYN